MKNKEYWIERSKIRDKKLDRNISKIEKQLKKYFVEAKKEVKKELALAYVEGGVTEYQKYRIESILRGFDKALDNLYHKEEELLTKAFINLYSDMNKFTSTDISVGLSFEAIDENLIREVIKTNWSGLTFSERIWEHRRRLALTLKEELKKGLARGDSIDDMARIFADKFNTAFSNAQRLVHTESCFIMNQATIDTYTKNDISKYEYMAFLDKRTSKQCENLNGKVFNTKDSVVGVNLPPLHPYCRSCVIPILD